MQAQIIGRLAPATASVAYFEARVPAGFPSPAGDYQEQRLSLDELVGLRAPHTYLVRVQGDSMIGAGIHDGDILVVDRAHEARPGCVVIAHVHGELTVKTLRRDAAGRLWLAPANPNYAPLAVEPDSLEVWGVVTCNLHFHARP